MQRAHKNALFVRLQFLRKYFFKIIWQYGIKVLTLQADTGSDLTQQKRTPRNVSTRTETTETKRAQTRYLTFGIIANKC